MRAPAMTMALAATLATAPRPARTQRGGWFRSTPATSEEKIEARMKAKKKEKRRAKTKAAKEARRRNRR